MHLQRVKVKAEKPRPVTAGQLRAQRMKEYSDSVRNIKRSQIMTSKEPKSGYPNEHLVRL